MDLSLSEKLDLSSGTTIETHIWTCAPLKHEGYEPNGTYILIGGLISEWKARSSSGTTIETPSQFNKILQDFDFICNDISSTLECQINGGGMFFKLTPKRFLQPPVYQFFKFEISKVLSFRGYFDPPIFKNFRTPPPCIFGSPPPPFTWHSRVVESSIE